MPGTRRARKMEGGPGRGSSSGVRGGRGCMSSGFVLRYTRARDYSVGTKDPCGSTFEPS